MLIYKGLAINMKNAIMGLHLSEYQYDNGQNPKYNNILYASADEDEHDWVYGYGESLGPSVYISGVNDIVELGIESELQPITHFWDADNFLLFETEGHNISTGYYFEDE